MTTLAARCLTPSAQAWLAQTRTAYVLSAFERACNLVNQDGAVLALVTAERGMAPFSMMVKTRRFAGISAGDPVTVAGNVVVIGQTRIESSGARLWGPTPDWAALCQALAGHPERLAAVAALAAEIGKPGSLLDLFISSGQGQGGIWIEAARRGARELVTGMRSRLPAQCVAGARALAGLGGGLTPAGDDFIVGVLLAIWAGLYGRGAETLCQPVAEAAAPATTTLSAAYLNAAARGECLALWHELFSGIIGDESVEALSGPVQALLSVGHTSGADALAGFLALHYFQTEEALP